MNFIKCNLNGITREKKMEHKYNGVGVVFKNRSVCKNMVLWGAIILLIAILKPVLNLVNRNIINVLSSGAFTLKIIIMILLGYMLLQFLGECLENISGYFGTKVFYVLNGELMQRMNSKVAKIAMREFEAPEIYNLITRIRDGVESSFFSGLGNIISVITSVVSFAGNAIILYTINSYFPIIVVVASVPYMIAVLLQGKDNYGYLKKINPCLRKERYINEILTSRSVMKDIRFFKLIGYMAEKAQVLRNNIYIKRKKLHIKLLTRGILTNFTRNLALGICLFILCYRSMEGDDIKAGDIVFLINTIQSITSTVTTISSNISSVNKFAFFIKDWSQLMEVPEETTGESEINGYGIKFEKVSFSYSEELPNVLSDISFEIKENEKVAIVGENGCGKSTLISLILGLYKPMEGVISVGGIELNDVLDDAREKMVCIFQNYNRYQLSIAENIYAGNFGEIHNEKSKNGSAEFIEDLPLKEKTVLGQLEEGAHELSGGQWQQLAIMRALYREGSKIIIMDAPTAGIDPKIENEIYENLTEITEGKTLILVSHRLSATSLCDKIIVLSEGEIIEAGNHEELLKKKGKYYQMYSCQKELYEKV